MFRLAITCMAIMAVSIAASPAHAQFSNPLKQVSGTTSAAATKTAAPDGVAQDALVQHFLSAQGKSLQAQLSFAKAFGLADQVQLLEAERVALSSGSVNVDGMKKARSVTDGAQSAIDAKQAEKPALNEEARGHYSQGLSNLLLAVTETRPLVTEAASFATGLSNGNAMQIAMMGRKLVAGAWVAKETPGYAKGLYGSTKAAFTYARHSKVEIPGNADSLLSDLPE